jgi:hypothetical protein
VQATPARRAKHAKKLVVLEDMRGTSWQGSNFGALRFGGRTIPASAFRPVAFSRKNNLKNKYKRAIPL